MKKETPNTIRRLRFLGAFLAIVAILTTEATFHIKQTKERQIEGIKQQKTTHVHIGL